jgi:hypothetical protein
MSATAPSPGILATIASVFRQNRASCLALNVIAISLVVSYYQVPALAGFWDSLSALKLRWSFAFACVSTMFAAAVLPTFIQLAQGTLPQEGKVKRLTLLMLFWGYRGMEIDLFYRLQGMIFGHGNDAATLVKKVVFDQFVASPLWFVPTYVIALRWVEMGGSWSRTRASLDREFLDAYLPHCARHELARLDSRARVGLQPARRVAVPALLGRHVLLHPHSHRHGAEKVRPRCISRPFHPRFIKVSWPC